MSKLVNIPEAYGDTIICIPIKERQASSRLVVAMKDEPLWKVLDVSPEITGIRQGDIIAANGKDGDVYPLLEGQFICFRRKDVRFILRTVGVPNDPEG